MGKPVFESVLPVEIVRPGVTGWGLLWLVAGPFWKAWAVMLGLGYLAPDWGIGYWKALWIFALATILLDHNGWQSWSRLRKEIR
jgi:hypothetical protein